MTSSHHYPSIFEIAEAYLQDETQTMRSVARTLHISRSLVAIKLHRFMDKYPHHQYSSQIQAQIDRNIAERSDRGGAKTREILYNQRIHRAPEHLHGNV